MCEWINAKKELPKEDGIYICYIRFIGISLCNYTAYVGNRKKWWLPNEQQVKGITHWMSIEEPKD